MASNFDFLGIDLGSDSIKIAQIVREGSKVRLKNIFKFPSSQELLTNESPEGLKKLSDSIREGYKNAKIDTKNCVIAVPEKSIFSRLITLPKVEEEKVSDAIHWALKPLVPTGLDNVNISYISIDEYKQGDKIFVNWYAVAAPKDLVSKLQTIIKDAGLNLLAIETEALAIARMTWLNYDKKSDLLILDIGAEDSNIVLARNGVALFSQTISTGSQDIDKIISADFGIDVKQAKDLKSNFSAQTPENQQKLLKSMEPILQMFVNEISRTLTYYRQKLSDKEITSVYLTGGGSKLSALQSFITQKLGLQVALADPIAGIEISKDVSIFLQRENSLSFNVAIGLALKGVE